MIDVGDDGPPAGDDDDDGGGATKHLSQYILRFLLHVDVSCSHHDGGAAAPAAASDVDRDADGADAIGTIDATVSCRHHDDHRPVGHKKKTRVLDRDHGVRTDASNDASSCAGHRRHDDGLEEKKTDGDC